MKSFFILPLLLAAVHCSPAQSYNWRQCLADESSCDDHLVVAKFFGAESGILGSIRTHLHEFFTAASKLVAGTLQVVHSGSGTLTVNGTFFGNITLGINSTAFGNLTLGSNSTFAPQGFNFTLSSNGNLTLLSNNGTLLANNGALLSNGTIIANGTLLSNGTLILNNGTLLSNSGPLLANGTLLSNNGTLLSNNGTILNGNGTVLINGTLDSNGHAAQPERAQRLAGKSHSHPHSAGQRFHLRPGTIRRTMPRDDYVE